MYLWYVTYQFFENVAHDSNSVVSCDVAGALKGPVCEKIIDSNYLIYAGNKNHRLSVYNPNEITFLYYAFLKAQSYLVVQFLRT